MAVFGGWRLTRAGILFVVGILVLGGLVTGGIFLVKNHGEAVRHDQAVKVAEQNLKDNSKVATQPTPSTDANNTSNNGVTHSDTNAAPATTPNPEGASASQLPVTGIDDLQVIGRAAILAVVAFVAVSYVSSRRAAEHL